MDTLTEGDIRDACATVRYNVPVSKIVSGHGAVSIGGE